MRPIVCFGAVLLATITQGLPVLQSETAPAAAAANDGDPTQAPIDQDKRAAEVLMFGNQQNKPIGMIDESSLAAGYFPTEMESNPSDSKKDDTSLPTEDAMTESKSMESSRGGGGGQRPNGDPEAYRSEIYGYPTSWQDVYFNGYDRRRKRGRPFLKRTPIVRRSVRATLPQLLRAQRNGRFKRELHLDRDDLIALMSILAAEKQNQRNNYVGGDLDEYDDNDAEEEYGSWANYPAPVGAVEERDSDEEWEDMPQERSHYGLMHRSPPTQYLPLSAADLRQLAYVQKRQQGFPSAAAGRWGSFALGPDFQERKRFMVAKKALSNRGDMYSLGQLLSSSQSVEPGIPVRHRYVL